MATAPTMALRSRDGRGRAGVMSGHLDGELVDLRRGVTCALVDSHDALAAWARRETEDLAGLRVEPGPLEVNALVALDRQIALVGFLELCGRDADEAAVNIHERRHGIPPSLLAAWTARLCRRRTLDVGGVGAIGHSTDGGLVLEPKLTSCRSPEPWCARSSSAGTICWSSPTGGSGRWPAGGARCCCSRARPASARRGCSAQSSGGRSSRASSPFAVARTQATSRSRAPSSSILPGPWSARKPRPSWARRSKRDSTTGRRYAATPTAGAE